MPRARPRLVHEAFLRAPILFIEQKDSPLGRRRHVACVDRRLRGGEPGAYVVGRYCYLTREALDEEVARLAEANPPTRKPQGKLDDLQRETIGPGPRSFKDVR